MTLTYSVCPICGKEFERLSLMVEHVDKTYTLTRLIEEIIKAKAAEGYAKTEYNKLRNLIEQIIKSYDRMSGREFYGWDTYEDLIHELERALKTTEGEGKKAAASRSSKE